jgi:hypothetical protein
LFAPALPSLAVRFPSPAPFLEIYLSNPRIFVRSGAAFAGGSIPITLSISRNLPIEPTHFIRSGTAFAGGSISVVHSYLKNLSKPEISFIWQDLLPVVLEYE